METIGKMRMFLFWHKLSRLCDYTDTICRHFCFNRFDICIINSKSSHYSENYTFLIRYARFVQRRRRNQKMFIAFLVTSVPVYVLHKLTQAQSLAGNAIWLRSELKSSHIMYFS